jgi:hypothetical protein
VRKYLVRESEGWMVEACSVMLNCALWLREAEVPVTLAVAVEVTTEAAAENVIFIGEEGESCREAGETVTPEGRPVMDSVTAELNPLEPVTVAVTDVDWPATIVTLDEESESVSP